VQTDAQIASIYSVLLDRLHLNRSPERKEEGLKLIEKGAEDVVRREEEDEWKEIRLMIFDLLILRSSRIRGLKRKSEDYRPSRL